MRRPATPAVGYQPPSLPLAGSGSAAPTIVAGGNLGAARTETVAANVEEWLTGTLNANHTLTLSLAAGSRLRLFGKQDATGGRTLTVSDGSTTQTVTVPTTANAAFEVDFYSVDGATIFINSGGAGATGPQGPTGPSGPQGPAGTAGAPSTATNAAYAPQLPALVVPAITNSVSIEASNTIGANLARLVRVVVPRTGTLHDLTVFVTTASGNHIGFVYDTGDATAGVRSKLWDSGSVAVVGANAWQVVGDPAIAVTAGQQLDIGIVPDNATVSYGRTAALTASAASVLPAGFFPAPGGASPKLVGAVTFGSFAAPGTIAEASITVNSSVYAIFARVT